MQPSVVRRRSAAKAAAVAPAMPMMAEASVGKAMKENSNPGWQASMATRWVAQAPPPTMPMAVNQALRELGRVAYTWSASRAVTIKATYAAARRERSIRW